jgi:hypothetical protein
MQAFSNSSDNTALRMTLIFFHLNIAGRISSNVIDSKERFREE